jgi:thiol-disulfide isomerase/thioredoxin
MSFIISHNNAFKAEWQKLKRSGMQWLLLGAALFVPLLNTTVSFFINTGEDSPQLSRWDAFIQSNFQGFTGFFFPLFLVLMVVRLVYLEHRSDTWKLMETQPVAKLSLYLAKWEVAALISAICLLGLLLFTLLGGTLLQIAKPKYGFSKSGIDWGLTISVLLRFWIASLAIISIQYFWGLLIKSFAWPMSIGLMAVIAGSIFAGFGVFTWWPYSATALTSAAYKGSVAGNFLLSHEKLSLVWSALFLWFGYQYFVRKSFARALLKPLSRAAVSLMLILLFIAATWWVSRPDTVSPYSKTVLAGTVTSAKPVATVVLLQAPAFDTVLLMPVKEGKFSGQITKSLPAGIYYLRAGSYRSQIFFGANDSLHIALSIGDKRNEEKITGTRIAENEYLSNQREENFYMLTNFAHDYKPDEYQREVLSKWFDESEKIEKFKTVDNIKPRKDFIEAQKSMLAIKLLNLVDNHYPRVFAVYNPNEQLKFTSSLKSLRNAANVNNPSLSMYADFRAFLNAGIRNKAGRNDSLYMAILDTSVQNKVTKDYLLYDAAQQDFLRVKDSAKRALLFEQAIAKIEDAGLKKSLAQKWSRIQSLQRGGKAPNFIAEALNKSEFDLSKLANRFVVLDVWATWCGPCKVQAPYFEELADRYTSEQVAFVSVSIDENKNAWLVEASGKKSRVLQLWAKNADEDFGKRFAIASIPRFILIDPRGNIINADLPLPSEPEFEATLQKEIPSLSNRL